MIKPEEEHEPLQLADLMAGFACSLPHVQTQLDAEWKDSLEQYLKALPPGSGQWLALAAALAPARQAFIESDLAAEFTFRRQGLREARVGVSLVDLSFERKFAHSSFCRHRLAMKVVAHSPGKEKPRA